MLLIKGSPGYKLGLTWLNTVATIGLLTASVTASWHVPSVYPSALLPDSPRSAAWRPDSPYRSPIP